MKKIILTLTILVQACFIVGCSNESNKSKIEFYNAVRKEPYSEVYIPCEEPLFTADDIEYYEWNSHAIVFKDEFVSQLEVNDYISRIGGSALFDTDSGDKFMVYVDDELIYDGMYNPSTLCSGVRRGAIMGDLKDGIMLMFREDRMGEIEDKREDRRILEALKSCDIYKDSWYYRCIKYLNSYIYYPHR